MYDIIVYIYMYIYIIYTETKHHITIWANTSYATEPRTHASTAFARFAKDPRCSRACGGNKTCVSDKT